MGAALAFHGEKFLNSRLTLQLPPGDIGFLCRSNRGVPPTSHGPSLP